MKELLFLPFATWVFFLGYHPAFPHWDCPLALLTVIHFYIFAEWVVSTLLTFRFKRWPLALALGWWCTVGIFEVYRTHAIQEEYDTFENFLKRAFFFTLVGVMFWNSRPMWGPGFSFVETKIKGWRESLT